MARTGNKLGQNKSCAASPNQGRGANRLWRQRPLWPCDCRWNHCQYSRHSGFAARHCGLPNSEILLPGLDPLAAASRATWSLIGKDPTHPQYGLHQLCRALRVDAQPFPFGHPPTLRLLTQTLKRALPWLNGQLAARGHATSQPGRFWARRLAEHAPTGRDWRARTAARLARALSNIELVEAQDQNHEAKVIALILRDCLETPANGSACHPNRDLARMVAAQMRRWDLDIDDSAGTPLDKSPPALLIRSLLDVASDGCRPVVFWTFSKTH